MAGIPSTLTKDAVWFVSGCSSGLGPAFAALVSKAGYRLVATAPDTSTLSYLPDSPNILKIPQDLTSPAMISAAMALTVARFGRLDVLINCDSPGLVGDVVTLENGPAREKMETNFWGAAALFNEAMRVFKEVNPPGQGGTIVQASCTRIIQASCTHINPSPERPVYYLASKLALTSFFESLALQTGSKWNINFLFLEPGMMMTTFGCLSMVITPQHPFYLDPNRKNSRLRKIIQNPSASKMEPTAYVQTTFVLLMNRSI